MQLKLKSYMLSCTTALFKAITLVKSKSLRHFKTLKGALTDAEWNLECYSVYSKRLRII